MLTQTYVVTIKDDAARVKASVSTDVTGDVEEQFSVNVPIGGDVVVPMTVDVSGVVAFWIAADGDLTMTENDDGSPDLTASLVADQPYWWHNETVGANPFTVDITSLKFTNAGGSIVTVRGAFLST